MTNYEDTLEDIDVDEIFVAGVDATRLGTASIKHLAKVWRISYKEAKRTLDITTQHSVRTQDPTLLQNMFWFAILIFRVPKCDAVNFDKYHLAGTNGMSISNFWCTMYT